MTYLEGGALKVVESNDRTRIIVALALTLVALPALLAANRRASSDRPATVAAVAPVGGASAGEKLGGGNGGETSSRATAPTAAPPTPAPSAVTTIVVAQPSPPASAPSSATYRHTVEGKASFQRLGADWGPAACAAVAGIPIGTLVHIMNLDSGLQAECTVRAHLNKSSIYAIVTDEAVFAAVGDPVAGVAPVRISW